MQHRLRMRDIINLAAPQTWAASVMPGVLALAISFREQGFIRHDLAACLFAAAVLMQSAVNTLNDYADFVKGTDTTENSPDASDAVIVYGLKPRTARNLGIGFLAAALIPGLYTVFRCGAAPLIIGLIGALTIAAYSAGRIPVSYLPLGEIVSGFVMGGLIPLAGVQMQTGKLSFSVLVEALPIIIGIGMIMFTNNGCDIEKDRNAGRKTLACLLGKETVRQVYRIVLIIWALCPLLIYLFERKQDTALVYLLCSLAALHLYAKQFRTPLGPETRSMMMAGITTLVVINGFACAFAVVIGTG